MQTKSLVRPIQAVATAMALAFAPIVTADIPDSGSRTFAGMYKVASSTDPFFPMGGNREWFLDFGNGFGNASLSGNVAVSLRQNPNVKVRIMAWQYFAKQNSMAIGNPYAEGSNKAVAKGVWQMRFDSRAVVFERGSYQVVMYPADPGDY